MTLDSAGLATQERLTRYRNSWRRTRVRYRRRTFRPDQNVQRLQVIVSLVNRLGLPAVDSDALEVYSDRHTIPDYARKAVATATQREIVVNYPDAKLLAPSRPPTRAEVAAMVYQALVAIGRTSAIKSVYVGLHSRS